MTPSLNQSVRPAMAQTAVAWALTACAIALFGLVLAYWSVTWLAPAPVARLPAPAAATNLGAAAGLFGTAAERGVAAGAGSQVLLRLVGVVAASAKKRGYAIMQMENGQTATVRVGETPAPGVVLAEVHANHVVLERNGVREVLTWPDAGRTGAGSRPLPPQ
jgi:general secretion pathway protein C